MRTVFIEYPPVDLCRYADHSTPAVLPGLVLIDEKAAAPLLRNDGTEVRQHGKSLGPEEDDDQITEAGRKEVRRRVRKSGKPSLGMTLDFAATIVETPQWSSRSITMNQIRVIRPYRLHGTWVFDDERVGLVQEPFVSGVPEMIDDLVRGIPGAELGFRMLFSSSPFPGFQRQLTWKCEEYGGNWYRMEDSVMEGWLCPALFRYYETAPANLYLRAEALPE